MIKESFKDLVQKVGHLLEAVDAICGAYPSMKDAHPALVVAVVAKAISDEAVAVHIAATKEESAAEVVKEHDIKLALAVKMAAELAAEKAVAKAKADVKLTAKRVKNVKKGRK